MQIGIIYDTFVLFFSKEYTIFAI